MNDGKLRNIVLQHTECCSCLSFTSLTWSDFFQQFRFPWNSWKKTDMGEHAKAVWNSKITDAMCVLPSDQYEFERTLIRYLTGNSSISLTLTLNDNSTYSVEVYVRNPLYAGTLLWPSNPNRLSKCAAAVFSMAAIGWTSPTHWEHSQTDNAHLIGKYSVSLQIGNWFLTILSGAFHSRLQQVDW